MTAISIHAMDIALDFPHGVARGAVLDLEQDRAPGMPLLGFVIAIGLSTPLWARIGFAAWGLLT